MALYALGDLHLAFQRPEKSMDAMGPVWVRHEEKSGRTARNWCSRGIPWCW